MRRWGKERALLLWGVDRALWWQRGQRGGDVFRKSVLLRAVWKGMIAEESEFFYFLGHGELTDVPL